MDSNENTETTPAVVAATTGYPRARLADAMVTALTHSNLVTRRRAEERMRRWQQVIDGMTNGTLAIGSRTPVDRFPAWVTLDVVHGGFVTGAAVAGGDLLPHEHELAQRVGVPPRRDALFAYYLTEPGMAELNTMLDTGTYAVDVPEEAVLLTLAWLVRAGDYAGAVTLLDQVEPYASVLRFAPRPTATRVVPSTELVWRYTAGQVRVELAAKRPNLRIDAMREALTVWAPFGDRLLDHWLATVAQDGRVATREPAGWMDTSTYLLTLYTRLAAAHTLCSKHRNPKSNLGIMCSALRNVVTGVGLTPRERGLLQTSVDAQIARRGRPGSSELAARRARDHADCAAPTHHAIAQLLVARLGNLPQDEGLTDVATVTDDIEIEVVVPQLGPGEPGRRVVTAAVPPALAAVVERAQAAPVDTLIERGVIPSAEVLAQLIPQISAATFATAYEEPALRALTAATYRAFRTRRSVLLLNLQRQVQIHELPWVVATERHASASAVSRSHAYATLNRVAALAIRHFPGTILPNKLVRELSALARSAQVELPLVEELAADIFMGTFSAKFAAAARISGTVLRGSLYERYYGIDYEQLGIDLDMERVRVHSRGFASDTFTELCLRRASVEEGRRGWRGSVAANGKVIEQSQILTTHNLAVLTNGAGADLGSAWVEFARAAFTAVADLVERVHHNPRPLATVKDAAYAWRQTLFFLSMAAESEHDRFARWTDEHLGGRPGHTIARLVPVAAGLKHVLAGNTLGPDTAAVDTGAESGRLFLGWATDGHWMLRCPPVPTD